MANSRSEPWFSLWSSLCYQGDVYTASYAAAPHIVQIAMDTPGQIDFSFFALPTAIEVGRANGRGPPVPAFLLEGYWKGLSTLMECISFHRTDKWDQEMVLSVAAAQAAAKGHVRLAEALLNLDDPWIEKINDSEQWD